MFKQTNLLKTKVEFVTLDQTLIKDYLDIHNEHLSSFDRLTYQIIV